MEHVADHPREVLVTGGCGFIGRPLVAALVRRGCRVRVLDDLSTGTPGCPPGAELTVGSVLDADTLREAARGVDLVVHLAGVVGMRLATRERELAHRVAAEGTRLLLRHTGEAPAVLFSSSAVYGLSDIATPMSERQPVDRTVPLRYDGGVPGYATGKWEMEQLGLRAAHDRPVLVVRPFNVVGAGQVSRYGMVVPSFAERALAGGTLTVHGDGRQTRCFSDVDEFVRLVLRLIDTPRAWEPGGAVVNVGTAARTSVLELAELVVRTVGRGDIRFRPYEEAFPGRTDVRHRVPDVSRLAELAGPSRWPSIEEVVGATVNRLAPTG
ncbi:NAD-dependent epimerase/dehydratase family protein [Streptomyces sp. NBC_00829]|uniref:NAD-dependent epimerase/dehydratase family protein n=1 Tax=Streptomyces sp. NBC_00829 TaxID=2903679 RepID=UPI00386EDB04|nr:NAD-dependent epimerase/dehydratase family protein [Streptomyces sp. NBC_00829]